METDNKLKNKADALTQHAIRSHHARYIKSIVLGGLDGVITTFVVVSGATGASLSVGVLLILGVGSLLGDAVSMGVSEYASSQSEVEYHETERVHHERLFEQDLPKERAKIIEVYTEKGLGEKEAQDVADILMRNKKTAVEVMMVNEHGLVETQTLPAIKGLYTFTAFLFFGAIPLLTYIIAPFNAVVNGHSFLTACILTSSTLFTLGATKASITGKNWFLSGLQMLATGGVSATVAYVIGVLLAGLA